MAKKTEAALDVEIRKNFAEATQRKKELLNVYKSEERVPVHISPMYRPHLGNVAVCTVNGITISIPVNGEVYKVPKTFAEHIYGRIAKIDAMEKKTEAMADIKSNFESSPGDLKLF